MGRSGGRGRCCSGCTRPPGSATSAASCAVTLSLTAQVVEAEPSVIGWVAAAVPALGFLVMVKVALGRTSTAAPTQTKAASAAPEPPIRIPRSGPDSGPDGAIRSAATVGEERSTSRTVQDARRRSRGRNQGTRADRGRSAQPSGDAAELLPAARHVRNRLAADGQPLTRAALAEALRASGNTVSNTRLSELLKTLKTEPPVPPGLLADPVTPTDPPPSPLPPDGRGGGTASNPTPATAGGIAPLVPHDHPSPDQEKLDHEQPLEPR